MRQKSSEIVRMVSEMNQKLRMIECENDLMEVKDLNAINKSVVSLWNQEKTDGESDGVNNEEGQQADTTELLKGNKRKAKDLAKLN